MELGIRVRSETLCCAYNLIFSSLVGRCRGRNPAQRGDASYHTDHWTSLSGNWQLASRGRSPHVTWLKERHAVEGRSVGHRRFHVPTWESYTATRHTCSIPPTRVRQVSHFSLRNTLMGLPTRQGTLGYLRRAPAAVDDSRHREPKDCCRGTRKGLRLTSNAGRWFLLAGVACPMHESGERGIPSFV